MLTITISALLVILTTLVHYEALGWLNARLPKLHIPNRSKLIIVIVAAFIAHAIEIGLYGGAFYAMGSWFSIGTLTGAAGFNLANCMYFSAETYTSLGFGDLAPIGFMRMLVGVEALNGLLLIGWSASFTYLCMERFWNKPTS